MSESILDSVKKSINIEETDQNFDQDVIMEINTDLSILTQMGIGPAVGFAIADKTKTWTDFLAEDDLRFIAVKSYVFMKAKLVFDPPASSAVIDVLNKKIAELEWRLSVAVDSKELAARTIGTT